MSPVYLDCAATTPVDPRVAELCLRFMTEEFGNAHSRTHAHGANARRAVEQARDQIAAVCKASRGDVIFTSGATESNNLALFGLEQHARATGRTHIISTAIEHRAVLEPLQELARRGFTLSLIPPSPEGAIDPQAVKDALREDTLLVSVMHVNNETGILQPIDEIAALLGEHPTFFHVDAAQSFAKHLLPLTNPRIDLISASGHKICAPKGIGALIVRRRGRQRPPLTPLLHGGGQERGLRAGTLPVHLIAGFGLAAELWSKEAEPRWTAGLDFRTQLLDALAPLKPRLHGDPSLAAPFIVNFSLPGWDSEAVLEAWTPHVSASDGAACTSQSYTCSHVLSAMAVSPESAAGAIRLSWCPLTPLPDFPAMLATLQGVAAH